SGRGFVCADGGVFRRRSRNSLRRVYVDGNGLLRRASRLHPDAGHRQRLRDRSFDNRRRISRYSHTRVTSSPKAPYHSICLGAPWLTPCSMKSKSSTRLSEARTTTNTLNRIPIGPFE